MSTQQTMNPQGQEALFSRATPAEGYFARMRRVLALDYAAKARRLIGRIPGFGGLRQAADRPRLMPLNSAAGFMARWYQKDYGDADKPAALQEIPWDYIEANQEDIPFFGLREYWYPALTSADLPHNQVRAVQLLGDNIVLFRGADGEIGALRNRCPHRGPLLSLGQSNVWEVGTLTCRYHGATFNTKGECVAFLADGPNSVACGSAKMQARAYPAQERNGVIFLWMGSGEPEDILTNVPRAPDTLADGYYFSFTGTVPYSYLNLVDNATDMTHVGCLHRTCLLFGDQKMGGGVAFEELDGRGVRATLAEMGGHDGKHAIDDIEWYMPGMVFHGREFLDGILHGLWFWWVPRDAGSFTAWFIGCVDKTRASKRTAKRIKGRLMHAMQSDLLPGLACFIGGDAPMQMSQGRVVRRDRENLFRGDRAVVRCRQMLKDKHRQEVEMRRALGLDGLVHRVRQPHAEEHVLAVAN